MSDNAEKCAIEIRTTRPQVIHMDLTLQQLFALGAAMANSEIPVYIQQDLGGGDETGMLPFNCAADEEILKDLQIDVMEGQ